MTLGERQPDTPIVGVPPAPKKSVCCTACHLCRTQECVPRIENACQQCDVCGMQLCTTCGLVKDHESQRGCRIATVCTGSTPWLEHEFCPFGCISGDLECCHPHRVCEGCEEGLENQEGHECTMVMLEVEWHTPPRRLVLVPESPPRGADDEQEASALPTAFVPETPPHLLDSPRFEPDPPLAVPNRKRRAFSPSMFHSEKRPSGRARSEPPEFKY